MKSTIRLFKAVPIKTKKRKTDKKLLKATIQRGFIFAPEVISNYSRSELMDLAKDIGLSPEELNSSFHKSWVKIKEASLEQLVVEQIAHYMTTYGKKHPEAYLEEKGAQWGVEDLPEKVSELDDIEMDKIREECYIYIPEEALDLPKIDIKGLKLVIIKGYTKSELKKKLLNLLNSGIALKEDTIKDVTDVATFVEVDEKDIRSIRNKEVKSALYDYLSMFPENPIEFLRFAVYKSTNKTLLIKSRELISEIKEKDNLNILKLFNDYNRKYGLERLAEIFYRFKPLFLAFRTNRGLKMATNKIRKLAEDHHKPMPEDYLNTVTCKLKRGERITKSRLKKELDRVNTFRKIRLAYALKFRTKDVDSILYKIRNGKAYATGFSFGKKSAAKRILNDVTNSIISDVSKNVKGKRIYIPKYINYALPATEKQFTGYFPSGTYVSIPKDIIFGIHWNNVDSNRIDLDLSLISPETGKIGWDSDYRTDARDILFSGDMTDASGKGATELFYIQRQAEKALILFVNYYNFNSDSKIEVPYKIITASEKVKDFRENYMVNPNNLIAIAESKINQKEQVLGLLVSTASENRFYFTETYLGKSITSSISEFVENARKYLFNFYTDTISLSDILQKSGAKMVTNKARCDIDLSPENLQKDTILNLLIKHR